MRYLDGTPAAPKAAAARAAAPPGTVSVRLDCGCNKTTKSVVVPSKLIIDALLLDIDRAAIAGSSSITGTVNGKPTDEPPAEFKKKNFSALDKAAVQLIRAKAIPFSPWSKNITMLKQTKKWEDWKASQAAMG